MRTSYVLRLIGKYLEGVIFIILRLEAANGFTRLPIHSDIGAKDTLVKLIE